MRPLAEQTFYELLELDPQGDELQLERAYRIARATYEPTSVATYSILSEQENAEILRRVEEAYAVLSDARNRREYDLRLRRTERERSPRAPQLAGLKSPKARSEPVPVWSGEPLRPAAIEIDESLEPEDGVYDGAVLRRIRLELGIELEEIATITKVNSHYLESVEKDRHADLPSGVYVRGFIKELAKCLGLDPVEVSESYMKAYEERSDRVD